MSGDYLTYFFRLMKKHCLVP